MLVAFATILSKIGTKMLMPKLVPSICICICICIAFAFALHLHLHCICIAFAIDLAFALIFQSYIKLGMDNSIFSSFIILK